ncbi:MAG: hypothetical protein ACRDQA_11465 [Nocardioidaceae bacterium]
MSWINMSEVGSMSVLQRLVPSRLRNISYRGFAKGERVIAARDLGDYRDGYVWTGATGVVLAVSRVGTYEVEFDNQVRLLNLGVDDVASRTRPEPRKPGPPLAYPISREIMD